MGRAFLVYFNQVYPDHSYVCRACRKAYIALPQDLLLPEFQDKAGNYYAVFLKVVNEEVEEPIHYRQVGRNTVADIYCVSCGSNLGFKYIQIGEEEYFMHGEQIKRIRADTDRNGVRVLWRRDGVKIEPSPYRGIDGISIYFYFFGLVYSLISVSILARD